MVDNELCAPHPIHAARILRGILDLSIAFRAEAHEIPWAQRDCVEAGIETIPVELWTDLSWWLLAFLASEVCGGQGDDQC